jgi:ribosome maturation factor RimP
LTFGDNPLENGGLKERLTALLEPVVRSEGLVLVELAFFGEGKGQILRLFVDRPEGGVTIDECALLSRQISDLLDVEDPIVGKYSLEVSSPGLTRTLKKPVEFQVFAGRAAKMTVKDEDGRTKTVKGVLKGVQEGDVLIEVQGKIRAYSIEQVAKAKLDLNG